MLLTDITKIIRVLLGAFEEVASQDELTQRRIDQIGQVIGAVEDVAETEEKPTATVAEKPFGMVEAGRYKRMPRRPATVVGASFSTTVTSAMSG